ncbi:MAG: GNAT family N-acetyltransferase [Spirochaetales bacterium]|nr:GNAT family N-acetyltransferase [Spirochaetales bacterium]
MNQWSDGARWTAEDVARTISAMRAGSDNEIWLAKDERGGLVGYAQIGPVFLLGKKPFYEIMQILVDRDARGRGFGTAILVEIERLVRRRGFKSIRLSSRKERVDAHRFYRHNGYVEFKSSKFFEKKL